MDESSQNDPGIQQKPTTETSSNYPAYPEYPQPAPANKPQKPRKLVIFAAGLILLLVLISAALFIQAKLNRSNAVACADEKCFDQHFSKCLPAAYTSNNQGGSIRYTILRRQEVGCSVSVKYLKATYLTSVVGKTMTCDFDNTKSFQTAAQNVFHFPADYGCTGNLVDLFKNINNVPDGS